ncbi:hypothetical protein [Amycolatopsis sp. NPDC001319]|uniref:hypothetical protein n=1 Tax=unclassified Amycolatopsis TaxID=2618356 RepID=UPI003692C9E4
MIAEHEGLKAVDFVCTASWCDKPGWSWSYTDWNARHKRPMLICPDWHLTHGRRRRTAPEPPQS